MEAEIRGIAARLTENEPEIKGSVSFGCEGKATTYSGSNKRARSFASKRGKIALLR